MSRDDGITLVAVYHYVMAGLFFLGALGVVGVTLIPLMFAHTAPNVVVVFLGIGGLAFLTMSAIAAVYLIAGIGVGRRQNWGRWMAIVLAVLALPGFPVGTIIGGLTIIFMLRDDVQAVYSAE